MQRGKEPRREREMESLVKAGERKAVKERT